MKKIISIEVRPDDVVREARRDEITNRRKYADWIAGGTLSRDEAHRRLAIKSYVRGLVEASADNDTVTVEIEEV
jgi:hypothetical protein